MALVDWLTSSVNRLVVPIVTLLIGFLIGKIAGKLSRRVLAEAEINRLLAAAGMALDDLLARCVEYGVYGITILILLQQFGLTKIAIGFIIAIVAILIGFSLVLAIRDFVPNFFAGFIVKKTLEPHLNKTIKIGMTKGKLKKIGVTECIIEDKEEHHVPHRYTVNSGIKQLRAN